MRQYEQKTFKLPELDGLSGRQIEEHLKLYAGYVKNVNALLERLEALRSDVPASAERSELQRRLGFEFDGMRLHERYFEQLAGGPSEEAPELKKKLAERHGDFDRWLEGFKTIAKMRGVGWALLVKDPDTGRLHDVWVSDHETGHLAGCRILLTLDIWEHAFLLDYPPAGRGDYIEAFFRNLDWRVVEKRFLS
ncbi:hypothetical protein AMJ57_04290 [Parcubacteria bacterium SG8_24]|nr:MAG: hypothetical protein AMJ57_04290 [Parcubacteria bacterium SG8_24]